MAKGGLKVRLARSIPEIVKRFNLVKFFGKGEEGGCSGLVLSLHLTQFWAKALHTAVRPQAWDRCSEKTANLYGDPFLDHLKHVDFVHINSNSADDVGAVLV